jgi:HD domain
VHATQRPQAATFVDRRPRVGQAYRFAARAHAGQRRESDAAAFIAHPLEVGALLDAAGSPEDEIVAGVLHDVLEKTDATPEALRREFGVRVASLVIALTEDPTIEPFEARKAALRLQIAAEGPAAEAISAADHVAKVRELRTRLAQARGRGEPDPADGGRKLGHYVASLGLLEARMPDHPLVRQLARELDELDRMSAEWPPADGVSPECPPAGGPDPGNPGA